jgi:large subunit ribosomal protein L17
LRKATVRDLAKATLIQQRICTTEAKAKEARKMVDKLITLGKKGTLADKRRAFAILCDHGIVSDLFNKTSPRFKDRAGGYTRIIHLGNRRGDNAQLALLELTEKEEVIITKPKSEAVAKKEKPVSEPAHAAPEEAKAVKPVASKKDAVKSEIKTALTPIKENKGGRFISGIRKILGQKSSGK